MGNNTLGTSFFLNEIALPTGFWGKEAWRPTPKLNWDSQQGRLFSLPSQRNFLISFKPKVAIAKFVWKMQKKVWYYEKCVGRHASFPPRRSVKCIYLIWELLTFILLDEKISEKVRSPNVGLEPTTLRLRVSCSTNWASRDVMLFINLFLKHFFKLNIILCCCSDLEK